MLVKCSTVDSATLASDLGLRCWCAPRLKLPVLLSLMVLARNYCYCYCYCSVLRYSHSLLQLTVICLVCYYCHYYLLLPQLVTTAAKADGTRVCKLCEGDSDSAQNMEGVLLGPFLDRLKFTQLNLQTEPLLFLTFAAFNVLKQPYCSSSDVLYFCYALATSIYCNINLFSRLVLFDVYTYSFISHI
jgi:hypothetical protein